MPRRVLMTADTVGGVWHYALELSNALAQVGVAVDLATMGAPLTDAQRAQCERVPALRVHDGGWRLEWMDDPWDEIERAADWLHELERRTAPELVHLNQFAFGACGFRAPTLLVAHSCVLSWWRGVHGRSAPPAWQRYREVVRRGLQGADAVAAPTRAMLDGLRIDYGFAGRGLVLPNGRDPARFAPGDKQPFVLSAGRFWDEAKNLTALDAVAGDLPWPVLVAGPLRAPQGQTASAATRVRLLGELDPEALAQRFAHAAIYALPARYEPFGLSVLEAALSGCALVLGDIDSLRETWGDSAVYAAPDDHDALRAALTGLIDDPPARAGLAAAARSRALRLSPQAMRDAYLDAYRTIRSETRACAS